MAEQINAEKISTLKRPAQAVKKRSGPLDDILDEVNRISPQESKLQDSEKIQCPSTTRNINSLPNTSDSAFGQFLNFPHHRKLSHRKDKEKKRERWLLTRKTWKYMTDAGRKLVPEGVQNRKEDIPKIDAHFQEMCAAEPRFIIWRRKASYPGAIRKSKRRLPQLLHHTGQKQFAPQTVEQIEDEEIENADQIVSLLQSYLKIYESFKTTALLGSNTVRPDQTSSPSAQRPKECNPNRRSNASSIKNPLQQLSEVDELLFRLRALQKSATTPVVDIPPDLIQHDILKNKAILKQIYNALKKRQLHRILSTNSNTKGFGKGLSQYSSLSLSNLQELGHGGSFRGTQFNNNQKFGDFLATDKTHPSEGIGFQSNKRLPPKSLNLSQKSNLIPVRKKSYSTCGVQTSFIPLQEIKRLAEDYKLRKRQEASSTTGGLATDGDTEISTRQGTHRKSSIDNEDVSQSVGDTIKRYLRMARKKSVQDSDASRFKRVNYDRNLRNIRAKGEIIPPGTDEGNSKAAQTLDAWPLIALDFIRGNESLNNLEAAHAEWQRDLDERLRNKTEYEKNLKERLGDEKQKTSLPTRSSDSSSAPTSPTSPVSEKSDERSPNNNTIANSIFHSSTQFLSSLWHGGHQNDDPSSSEINMQKSKSASNVGNIVSRKLLKTRSKSQSRLPSGSQLIQSYSKWHPSDKCTWLSENGDHLQLSDALLQNLSEIEAKYLRRVALEKISELNVGIIVNIDDNVNSQKRRVLSKKKSSTTNFFEIGRKNDEEKYSSGKKFNIFGNSLESCVENDRQKSNQMSAASKDRGSRSSITSLFRSGNESVRSCESLPSSTNVESVGMNDENPNNNLKKSSSMLLSSSKWDMLRRNAKYATTTTTPATTTTTEDILDNESDLQVPKFFSNCIKYLEEHGLHQVGLFRVSTSKKRVKQMREDFNKHFTLKIQADTCPHDVATLLKEFLRDLPEPLLCDNLYNAFLQTQKIRNRRLQLEALSHLIKLLPEAHRDTLYVLLRFLAQVASNSDDVVRQDGTVYSYGNKMDSNNLATVFAPNLLRKTYQDENSPSFATENINAMSEHESMNDSISVIRTMIDHYEDLFRVPADLLDVAYSYMLDECPEQLYITCDQYKLKTMNETNSSSSPFTLSDDVKDNEKNLKTGQTQKFHIRQAVTHENNAFLENTNLLKDKSLREPKRGRHSRKERSIERRQSSPNVLTKRNIISGSLQISVPKQTSDLNTADNNHPSTVTTSDKSRDLIMKKLAEDFSTQSNAKKATTEPKLPASITSIGGAILRSKTEDFERLSLKKNPSANNAYKSGSSTSKLSSPAQHLYKRQELISSKKGINSS